MNINTSKSLPYNLHFRGPFSYPDLTKELSAFNPGIYIWGFKFPESKVFIPYYVGKSESNIVSRISQHKKDIIKADSTYMRFSTAYMKEFYHDCYYPINPSRGKKSIPNNYKNYVSSGKILYLNNKEKVDPDNKLPKQLKDFPINILSPRPPDFLKRNINNIFICYAYWESKSRNLMKHDLEELEALTKYSLKGRTIGKSNNFNSIKDSKRIITCSNDCKKIFNCSGNKIFAINHGPHHPLDSGIYN